MKFAKYQQNNLVPEWRKKYLDYKKGKKLLNDVARSKARQSLEVESEHALHDDERTDDGHNISHSTSYGTLNKLRRHSPSSPKGKNVPPITVDGAQKDGARSPTTTGGQTSSPTSEDSTTPMVRPPSPHIQKSGTARPRSASSKNIRQVLGTIRRGRRVTAESFDSDVLRKINERGYDESEYRFLNWLDSEIMKIDEFYKQKEEDAVHRYKVLSEQLDALRQLRESQIVTETAVQEQMGKRRSQVDTAASRWVQKPFERLRASFDGFSSAMPGADHERRAKHPELMAHPISTTTGYAEYRMAKRRLKRAVLEFYHAMELLKGYRLLNRTGLTKILKKFDKTTGRNISADYQERLKSAHLYKSEKLEEVMSHTEDLYARYFEHNNRKNAVERLRSREKPDEHIPAVFNVGFLLGTSIPFLLEGIIISQESATMDSIPQASYLLQVWGGFSLVVLFLMLFGINCWVYVKTKIHYTFIFEFDTKHHLDHRQYMELPALLGLLGSLFFWLTFKNFWPDTLYATWYPLIYLCICVGILFFPFDILHRNSRRWFAIANFRILFSGLYPIEFRDFFLGDQYNSLIYSFANISLFFCLYSKDWNPQEITLCNSTHSRVLGFFSTLPPIWRFLQCIRRFIDTKNYFPHLVNAGKYSATILMYTMLSLWRIEEDAKYKALFIVFATTNTLYCSWWDIFMDWSLMQPHAEHPFLRTDLGYNNPLVYYLAIFVDPIMRFSWLFYVIMPGQKQHSAATSFFIALGEVFRRFIWNFFRMENEHMTNVGQFLATRDVPLPFSLPSPTTGEETLEAQRPPPERVAGKTMGSVKRGMMKMTSSLRIRHAEDFGRKPVQEQGFKGKLPDESDGSSDINNEDDLSARTTSHETRPLELRQLEQSGRSASES